MYYNVSTIGSRKRYKYVFENGTSCVFIVEQAGIIYIEIKETIPFEYLCAALDEVCDTILEKKLVPTINIKNSNHFLKRLAKKSGFKQVPSKGISFSVWIRKSE